MMLLMLLGTATGPVQAQPGKNGALTVSAANTVVNTYTNVTANITAGATTIAVANSALTGGAFGASPLAAGDLIMIIQMQGASISTADDVTYGTITSYNNAGLYEFACVSAVPNATTIALANPVLNNYTATGKVQIVRIPRLTTLTVSGTITAPAWNGTTGGVVAIETASTIALNNSPSIDVSGRGFRGGALDNSSQASGTAVTTFRSTVAADGGEKGESIAGYQTDYDGIGGRYGRGAPANGGGGGNSHNAGGGGGANGNNGVAYTGSGNPSTSTPAWANAWNLEASGFATSTSSGGGRGGYTYAGSDQDALTVPPGNSAWAGNLRRNAGGRGGRPLSVAGGRLFLGGGGGAGDANNNSGGAGGAGGGLVFIIAGGNVTGNGSIAANGAAGANTTGGHNDGPGGGGGGGTVVIYNRAGNVANSITIAANGGAGGNQLITTNESEGPGGGGGGGYIAISSGSPTQTVNGAANGTTTSAALAEFTPNGATRGGSGLINTYTAASSLFTPVTGTVLNDANGHTDNIINGTGSNLGGALYISAVQGGNVVATVPVAGTGSFSFTSLPPGTYNFVLHNNPGGSTSSTLPAGAASTAEGITVAGDGTVNGLTTGGNDCAALSGLLFGFNRLPSSTDYTGSGFSVPPGNNLENVPTAAFNGTDPEDGVYANNLNGRSVELNPATGGTLYYFDGMNYIPITGPTVINNFNNDNVYVDPTAPSGPTTVSFTYRVADNGGLFNGTPATVTMQFGVLLPATGLSLSGVAVQGKVLLQWQTLTEQNTKHFVVEYSADGGVFQPAGQVAAAGQSSGLQRYQYQWSQPVGTKYLYRVKLVDKDGSVSYSNTISIQTVGAAGSIRLVPNPAHQSVWVSGLAKATTISIVNTQAVVLSSVAVTAEKMRLDTGTLPTGVYFVKVDFADGSQAVVKMYKQ